MARRVTLNRIISSNIVSEMRLQGLTVGDFSRKTGISENCYHNKMQGRTPWKDIDLDMISRGLKMPVAALVTRRGE